MNTVAEIIARAICAAKGLKREDNLGWPDDIAHAIIAALEGAGKKIVDREPTREMVESGLTITAIWHDLPGSQLQVNRQKMVLRFGACWDAAPSWARNERGVE